MNKFCAYGRISSDIDFRVNGEHQIARFSLAINRRSADKKTDFLRMVAFGKQAELINNNFKKGSRIALEAMAIQPDKYTDQNGNTRYPNVEFWVNSIDFVDTKTELLQSQNAVAPATDSAQMNTPERKVEEADFMSVPEGVDEDLPFS